MVLAAGCTTLMPVEDRPCPCLEGWTCCDAEDLCVRDAAECGGSGEGRGEPENLEVGAI